MIHKSYLFTGKPIKIEERFGLGEIIQPTIRTLFENQLDITEFIEPFYLEELLHGNIKDLSMMNTLYAISQESLLKGKEPILLKLQKSLSVLYDIDINVIKLDLFDEKVIIKILKEETKDDKSNIKYIIDDDNIHELSKTVLEMTVTEVKREEEKEMIGDPEIVAKFKARRAEEAKRLAVENRFMYYDMCNQLIHMQEVINYDSVLNLTIWQLKNSYNLLLHKEVTDNLINSGSVKYDVKSINDWRKHTKLK